MKRCPICQTEYSDEAEYCVKCKTLLLKEEKTTQKEKPKQKVNIKGLVISIVATCAFIAFMMLVYNLVANIPK